MYNVAMHISNTFGIAPNTPEILSEALWSGHHTLTTTYACVWDVRTKRPVEYGSSEAINKRDRRAAHGLAERYCAIRDRKLAGPIMAAAVYSTNVFGEAGIVVVSENPYDWMLRINNPDIPGTQVEFAVVDGRPAAAEFVRIDRHRRPLTGMELARLTRNLRYGTREWYLQGDES